MIIRFFLIICILYSFACGVYKSNSVESFHKTAEEVHNLSLSDTLLVNKFPSLNTSSKIKSVHFEDLPISINIGVNDVDGNEIYNDPDQDLFVVTTGENRQVRINAEYGTPHCSIKDSIYVQVDSELLLIYDFEPNGSKAKLIRLHSLPNQKIAADILLKTYCKGLVLNKYSGNSLDIDSIINSKEYTYIYFWNTNKLEYQLNKVENIFNGYKSTVNIVGVHCKDHELDNSTMNNFFDLLSKPWNGSYCSLEQYHALNQDYSWYRGLLINKDGKIIFPHINPKELENWLKKQGNE